MAIIEDLPIMPLNSVLYPGAPTTLYIHEERYRRMLEEVVEAGGYFGVALLRAGKEVGGPSIPHDVGTIARVAEVTKLPDGSSMVLAQGGPRFKIRAILSAMPIVRAEVDLLDDRDTGDGEDATGADLARAELRELMSLVLKTIGSEDVDAQVPRDPEELSWAIAANLQMELARQQEILEMDSPGQRLGAVLPVLRKEIRHYRVMAAAREKLESLGMTGEDEDSLFSRN
ncbi:MAG: LON peptidase substrate-binding domain-containing protein [Armatimonadota bacterium]